jgi:hypothetical protein
METTYYLIGLFMGIFMSAFFIGKELYKYYTKYTIEQKKLNQILKLNDKINKFKDLKSIKTPKLNSGL